MTVEGWEHPDWNAGGQVHNWRNYIDEEVQAIWHTFTREQKLSLASQAERQADKEDWD